MNTEPDLPVVSVITTSYNNGQTISDTLQSVAAQKYPHIEHIIIDGASKDNTLQIVRQFAHVKKVVTEPDEGLYDAMNKGLALCDGDIIGFLNSDDFYVDPDVIRLVVEQFIKDKADALYADLVYVHPVITTKIVRKWRAEHFDLTKFLFGWMPPHPTFFVKKEIYDRLGGFNTSLKSSADYELMLRFLYKHKIKVSYLPQVIIKMRTGGMSNATLINRIKANKEDRAAWKINNLKAYFFTPWLKPLRKITQYI
jgi:glycosyltransferase